MGSFNLKPVLLHLFHFVLALCSFRVSSAPAPPDPLTDIVCSLVNCGHGTCRPDLSIPPFDCECDPGWKQVDLGLFKFPPCILPNCKINLGCGSAAPPPPPAPLFPPLLPPINISEPCNYTSCGDGTCVSTGGLGYRCDCHEGSANILNMSGLACLPECSLGVDCGFGFGPPGPPPTSDTERNGVGSREDRSFSANHYGLTALLSLAVFVPWL